MQKFNLSHETIVLSNSELTQALRSNEAFGITITGEIKYAPYDPVDIFIYQTKTTQPSQPELTTFKQGLLAANYTIVEEDEQILIKAEKAWQEIINYNMRNCHYHDTLAEGVTEFADEEIEDMGWMIIDFDVSYTELIKMLEDKADITLVCVESKEPYQLSRMGYFNDVEGTRKILFDFCQSIIKEKIANDADYALELLDEDQREAVEFFEVI